MALNRHVEQGGEVTGVWQRADELIKASVENAKQYQNPDGSFSTNYFERPGQSRDLAQNLGTTGHIVEFLTLALTKEELQQPWVKRAVANMCGLFSKTKEIPLECGALYHAAHGLVVYRDRVYGVRKYASDE